MLRLPVTGPRLRHAVAAAVVAGAALLAFPAAGQHAPAAAQAGASPSHVTAMVSWGAKPSDTWTR